MNATAVSGCERIPVRATEGTVGILEAGGAPDPGTVGAPAAPGALAGFGTSGTLAAPGALVLGTLGAEAAPGTSTFGGVGGPTGTCG